MTTSSPTGQTGKKKKKPRGRAFSPGQNRHDVSGPGRGADVVPRRGVVIAVQAQSLAMEQLRDPRTGRLSRSKWAKGVRAAGLKDFLRAHTRLLYALAHGEPGEAAQLASALTKTGESFAAYLDDTPAGGSRVTQLGFSTQPA